MRLRKIGDNIFLGVYVIDTMKLLNSVLCVQNYTSEVIFEPLANSFFCSLNPIKIASDGEAYVTINRDKNYTAKFELVNNVGTDYIETLVKARMLEDRSFEVHGLDENNAETFIYSVTRNKLQKHAKELESILNVWNDNYNDDDLKICGFPFDPIKQEAFKPYWNKYFFTSQNRYATRTVELTNTIMESKEEI